MKHEELIAALKSGEYDGTHIMQAWIRLEALDPLVKPRTRNPPPTGKRPPPPPPPLRYVNDDKPPQRRHYTSDTSKARFDGWDGKDLEEPPTTETLFDDLEDKDKAFRVWVILISFIAGFVLGVVL